MEIVFYKCTDAIDCVAQNKAFSCFHSTAPITGDNIHTHDCCEIFFCTKGSGSVFVDEKIYKISSGDMLVMNQFEAHKISSDNASLFERYVLQIHPSFLYNWSTTETNLARCFNVRSTSISHKIQLDASKADKLENMFKRLSNTEDFGDDVIKTITAIEMVAFANDNFKKQNKQIQYQSSLENKTLDIAIDYINKNFSESLNLESVARASYVSVNELCKLFKKHLGTTVSKYIASKRISEAKKMLRNGSSVIQTAEKCGFADDTSFIRAFSRAVGVAPGKYKKTE
jgi:AraC-like DNA-binding protein